MDKLEPVVLSEVEDEDIDDEDEALRAYNKDQLRFDWKFFSRVFPLKLICAAFTILLMHLIYYERFCVESQDGAWVSKNVYPPANFDGGKGRLMHWLSGGY